MLNDIIFCQGCLAKLAKGKELDLRRSPDRTLPYRTAAAAQTAMLYPFFRIERTAKARSEPKKRDGTGLRLGPAVPVRPAAAARSLRLRGGLGYRDVRAKRLCRIFSSSALPDAPTHPACCSHLLAPLSRLRISQKNQPMRTRTSSQLPRAGSP